MTESKKKSANLELSRNVIQISVDFRKVTKAFKWVQFSSIFGAALLPITLELLVMMEHINIPILGTSLLRFIVLVSLIVLIIVFLPWLIKKSKSSNKKLSILKKEVLATYLIALDKSNVNPIANQKLVTNE